MASRLADPVPGPSGTPRARGSRSPAARLAFLVRAGDVLAASLDYAATLHNVARLAVPVLADLCLVDVLEREQLRRVATIHFDPRKQAILDEISGEYPPTWHTHDPGPTALRTGNPFFVRRVTDDTLRAWAQDGRHLALWRQLGVSSLLSVPLVAHGRNFGAVTLGITEGGGRYGAADLRLAEDLGRRAAAALDNARLYREAHDAARHNAESLALVDTLLAGSPLGIAILDRDLRYVRVNPALAAINGIPPEAHIGRRKDEIVPDVTAQIGQRVRRILDTGEPLVEVEVVRQRPPNRDGPGHYLVSCYPVQDGEGKVLGIGTIVADVTTRRQDDAERARLLEALGRERELLRAVIEQMPCAVGVADAATGQILQGNDRLARLLPAPGDAPRDGEAPWRLLRRALDEDRSIDGEELEAERPDGSPAVLRVSAAPVHGADGRVAVGVLTAEDVTDQKRAEAAVLDSNARLEALLAASPMPIITKDRAGNVTLWNPAAERVFGWTAAEVLGGPLPVVAQGMIDEYRALRARVSAGEPVSGLVVRRQRRDGSLVPLMMSTSPVYDFRGMLAGTVTMYADLTERSRFMQAAAHELRNPLAAAKGMTALFRRRLAAGAPPDSLGRLAELMEREVDHLARLVDDMSDAFRAQEGRLTVSAAPLDLREVLASVLRSLEGSEDRQRIDHPGLPAGPVPVRGDATRLEQVARNLLTNALKYSPKDGRVWVELRTDGDRAELSVRDQGIGIPPGQLPRIFDAFYRVTNPSAGDPGGLGLGLYICNDLVQRHGGHIHVESAEGRGTTFRVELPLSTEG